MPNPLALPPAISAANPQMSRFADQAAGLFIVQLI
jgi:hypothetical protein